MAIPQYTDPRVSPTPVPGIRSSGDLPIEAFGGGQGLANVIGQAAGIGQATLGVAEKAANRARQLEVQEFASRLSAAETDAKVKLQGVKGRDALSAFDSSLVDFEKTYRTMTKGIRDPQVQQAVHQQYLHSRGSLYDWGKPYAASELRNYDKENTLAYVANEQNAAITSYQDLMRVSASLGRQDGALRDYAVENGIPEEELKRLQDEAANKTLSQVIARVAADDWRTAKDYFTMFSTDLGQLNGPYAAATQKVIETASVRGMSQEEADRIFSMGLTQKEAEALAKKDVSHEETQKETLRRLGDLYEARDKAIKEQRRQAFEGDVNLVEKMATTDAIPPERWLGYSLAEKKALLEWERQVKSDEPVKTDDQLFYEMKLQAAYPDTREAFMRRDIYLDRARLSKSDFDEMVNLQTGLIKGDAAAKEKLDGFRSTADIVSGTIAGSEIAKNKAEVEKFRRVVDDEIRIRQKATGKDVSPDEVGKIVDDLFREVVTKPGFLWDTKQPLYQLKAEAKKAIPQAAAGVPDDERVKIEAALKTQGKDVSDAAVLAAYRRLLEIRAKKLQGSK